MSRGFIVRPLAEADLEDAARWYEDEQAGFTDRFFSDVDRTLARIRERPFSVPRRSILRVQKLTRWNVFRLGPDSRRDPQPAVAVHE